MVSDVMMDFAIHASLVILGEHNAHKTSVGLLLFNAKKSARGILK